MRRSPLNRSPRKTNVYEPGLNRIAPQSARDFVYTRSPDGRRSGNYLENFTLRKSFSSSSFPASGDSFSDDRNSTRRDALPKGPFSLEIVAERRGMVSPPDFLSQNSLVKKLRDSLASCGNKYCGGGFVQWDRLFTALNEKKSKMMSREIFLRLVQELASNSFQQPSESNELFELFCRQSTGGDMNAVSFEYFTSAIKVADICISHIVQSKLHECLHCPGSIIRVAP